MAAMGIKMLWTLALFVLTCPSHSQGVPTPERISYLRLENGIRTGTTYTGSVVVRLNNEDVDGVICGVWTREDANVTCKMLGYGDGNIVTNNPLLQVDIRNYLFSNLRCRGQENLLTECLKDEVVNCGYDTPPVAVSCSNPQNPVETYFKGVAVQANRVTLAPVSSLASRSDFVDYTNCPTPGNIRLHGIRDRPGMGFVQVLNNGVWQYICDDSWSENDAKVVCNQLCYPDVDICARPGVESQYRPNINENPVNFAWNRVNCRGDENNIVNCQKNTTVPGALCNVNELAGVQCVPTPNTTYALDATLECNDLNGDLVLVLSRQNFPNIDENSFRVINQTSGAAVPCATTRARQADGSIAIRVNKTICGTTMQDNSTHICYRNTVNYDNEVYTPNNVLLDYTKKTFNVECCLPTDTDVSIKFVPKTQEFTQTMTQKLDYVPDISFYVNERCDEKINANPYSVQVGDWVYIGVSVKADNMSLFRDSDLKLVVTRCTANPIRGVPNPNFPENVTLIENKCPADLPSVTTYPISNTTEGFRFKAFKFYGYSTVYVTCHLRVCMSSDSKPQCDRSCQNSNINGRKRRDLAGDITGLDTVVSQTLQIVDPRQPPVKALPVHARDDRTVESINPRFLKP